MERIIDPTSDLGFKLLFGRKKISEPVLKDLLNALLHNNDGYEEIEFVSYLNNERKKTIRMTLSYGFSVTRIAQMYKMSVEEVMALAAAN